MKTDALELIIFDLDGTLVNSVPDLTDALNNVLSLKDNEKFNELEVKKMVGSGVTKLVKDAAESVGYKKSITELLESFKKQYTKNLLNKTKPYKGVKETLQALSNYKKVVLSNKLDAFTKEVVSGVGLADNFEMILGANKSLYQSKPSPEGIQYILKTLNIKPENAMMIGDSTHDINAAKKAGLKSCAVTYGYRSKNILEKELPDFIVDNLVEILKILNQK